jgi:hypothetical protein
MDVLEKNLWVSAIFSAPQFQRIQFFSVALGWAA